MSPQELYEIQAQLDMIQASDRTDFSANRSTPEVQQGPPQAAFTEPYQHHTQTQSRSTPTPSIPPPVAHAAPKMDFGNLLRDLASAGVIASNGSTPGKLTPVLSRAAPVREESVGASSVGDSGQDIAKREMIEDLKEYEDMVLALDVHLTLTDLNKT